jgi:hypothetical protein
MMDAIKQADIAKVVIDFSVLAFAMEDALRPLMTTPSFLGLSDAKQTDVLQSIVSAQMQHVASLVFMGSVRASKAV